MKLIDVLTKECVFAELEAEDRDGVIKELLDRLVECGRIDKDKEQPILKALIDREELGSTAIGNGVAIPHAKLDAIDDIVAAFGISHKGVDFNALDGEKVYLFFLLVAPSESAGPHLKVLARITRLLRDKNFRETLMQVKTKEEAIRLIEEEDARYN